MGELFGAIILTRNRKKMIKDCIDSIRKQKIEKIIVIDNMSNDGTTSFLQSKYKKEVRENSLKIISLKKNVGSAGGYNKGIKEAINLNLNWVWLIDDDCEALKNSLKELKKAKNILESYGEKIGYLSSKHKLLDEGLVPIRIKNKSKNYLKYLDYSLIELNWSVYTGTLVNLNVLKEVGLPIKEMFLYEDDTEFTYRIGRVSKGFIVGKSHILHKDYFFEREKFTPRNKKIINRQRYALRNGVYFSKKLFRENLVEGVIHFVSIQKNILFETLFSKNVFYFPILFFWFFKGFFFNPKIEKI